MKAVMKSKAKGKTSGLALISRERTEKRDLVLHLIMNTAHSLIVCGPEGVGKTFLLHDFERQIPENWAICWINGETRLSFQAVLDTVRDRIAQVLPDPTLKKVVNGLDRLASRDAKAILIIDDAGHLAPGLLDAIIEYAVENPILRAVFALTHSELYLKGTTDPATDECYQIELPPFSQKQCGDYLEFLAKLPNPRVHLAEINDNLVAEVFRESHGLPGAILRLLPEQDVEKEKDYSNASLIFAVLALIAVALAAQFWSGRSKPKQTEQVAEGDNPDHTDPKLRQLLKRSTLPSQGGPNNTNAAPPPDSSPAETAQMNAPDSITKAGEQGTTIPTTPSTGAAVTGPQATNTIVAAQGETGRWLAQQPVENYTLQVMALSNEQTIIEVLQRHQQALGQGLKYLKTKTRRGKDRFVLLYGSFPSMEQAYLESRNLPRELQKVWPRKLGTVQAELVERSQIPPAQPSPAAPLKTPATPMTKPG